MQNTFAGEVHSSFRIEVSVKPSCKLYNNSLPFSMYYNSSKHSLKFATTKFNCVKYTIYHLSVPNSIVLSGKNNPNEKVFGRVSISPRAGIDHDGIDPVGNTAYVGVFIPAGQNVPVDIYEGTVSVSISY